MVDSEILNILRNRKMECEQYYGQADAYPTKCAKARDDFVNSETNWFIKCESSFLVFG